MYRGLFWLADDGRLITYKLACDMDGILVNPYIHFNSRRGDSITHKATWAEAARLEPRETRCKSWNYYPRGRVEVRASKASIYFNPELSTPEFEQRILDEFGLMEDNALLVRFIADHSMHYRHLSN
jgi:hypothetical protein